MANDKGNTIFIILLLFIVPALIMLRQLVTPGYFSVQPFDIDTYSSMAAQFTVALHEGLTYPRWMPSNFWGYGSPTFILYSPLAYYLVAMLEAFNGSLIFSMNLAKFLALFFSGTGMFFLVREFYSQKIAIMSAIFYIILPFHIFQFYLVESFASVISLIWFAPILLFIHKYVKSRQYKYMIYAGACYCGLIFTYIVHAYLFAFVITAYVICISTAEKNYRYLFVIPAIFLIGITLSAAHFFPFLLESHFVNINAFATLGAPGNYHYSQGFILPDLSVKNPPDNFWHVYYKSYVLHIFTFLCLALFSFFQISRIKSSHSLQEANTVNKFFLGMVFCSILFLFGISTFLWESIPFFKYVQFPKRLLNICSFAVAFLSSPIIWSFTNGKTSKPFCYLFIGTTLSLILILDYRYISMANIVPEKALVPAKGINLVLEHLPKGVRIDKLDRDEVRGGKVRLAAGEGKVDIASWGSAERVISTSSSQPSTIWFRTFNFPGWTAYLDGTRTIIREEQDTKAILVDVPEGNHTLRLVFEDTPVRLYGKLISFVSLLSLLAFMVFDILKSRKASLHA